MSDNIRHSFPDLDKLSTEQLRYMLCSDSQDDSGITLGEDLIFAILEVLAEREKDNIPDVDQAWKEFNEVYRPYTGEELYCDEDLEKGKFEYSSSNQSKSPVKISHFFKRVGFVAAVLGVLFLGSLGAYAFGFDLFGAMGEWTREIFGFTATENSTLTASDDELHEYLAEQGVEDGLVPHWLPERYVFEKIDVKSVSTRTTYSISFVNDKSGEYIFLDFTGLTGDENNTYGDFEKDGSSVELHEINGITYYVFKNMETTVLMWSTENFEAYMSGDFTYEESEKIIMSIIE